MSKYRKIPPINTTIEPGSLTERATVAKQVGLVKLALNPFPWDGLKIENEILTNIPRAPIDPDFIGVGILAAASIAIGNRYKLRIKDTYTESACIWICLAAPPAFRKSFQLSAPLKALYEKEKCYKREYNDQIQGGINEPIFKQILIQDTTIEGLLKTLNDNPNGLGLYLDELASLFSMFGRYNKNGAGVEQEYYKSMWSGQPIKITRKTTGTVFVEDPFLTISGTIQPARLGIFTKGDRSSDGFLDRFLFVIKNESDFKPFNHTDEKEGLNLYRTESALTYILRTDNGYTIGLNDKARSIITAYKNKLEAERGTHPQAGMIGKLQTYVYRFALIIEVFEKACIGAEALEVTEYSANKAVELCEFFKRHAEAVKESIEATPFEKLSFNDQNFYEALPDKFTRKQALDLYAIYRNDINPASIPNTVTRLISNKNLFTKRGRGNYEKV